MNQMNEFISMCSNSQFEEKLPVTFVAGYLGRNHLLNYILKKIIHSKFAFRK